MQHITSPDSHRKNGSKLPSGEKDTKNPRKYHGRAQRNNNVTTTTTTTTTDHQQDGTTGDLEAHIHVHTTNRTDTIATNNAQEHRGLIAASPSIDLRTDPAITVYSGMPAAKFYDTKLYPSHHMSVQEIDQELKDLETKREESRTKMSDLLADHVNRINSTMDYASKLVTSKPDKSNTGISKQRTRHSLSSSTEEHTTHGIETSPPVVFDGNNSCSLATPTVSVHSILVFTPTTKATCKYLHLKQSLSEDTRLGDKQHAGNAERIIPQVSTSNSHHFLGVVDIDKRVFGMGPIQSVEQQHQMGMGIARPEAHKGRRGESTALSSASPSSSAYIEAEHHRGEGRGMHARLEALSEQLDNLEQSAQVLQHDLAFSVKVYYAALSHSCLLFALLLVLINVCR